MLGRLQPAAVAYLREGGGGASLSLDTLITEYSLGSS